MTGLVVLARPGPIAAPSRAATTRLLALRLGLTGVALWDGVRPNLLGGTARVRRAQTHIEAKRATGYPCPFCWVSRGTLDGIEAHLRFWHTN